MASDGCMFCTIVDGAAPSSRLVETDRVLAFLDIDPVTRGHALVVPKEHLPDLADLSDDLAAELLAIARRIAAAIRRTDLRCEGMNLFYADGEAAFQEVFHAHLHVFPRYKGDGFVINANWGSNPERADLDAVASMIRVALEQ